MVFKAKNNAPGEKSCSGTAKQTLKNVTAFAGKNDPLSNFYPCGLKLYGMLHKSAEHAYQYKKAMQIGNDKVATCIHEAKSSIQAKIEAKTLIYNPHWMDQKEKVMEEVLSAKAARVLQHTHLLRFGSRRSCAR